MSRLHRWPRTLAVLVLAAPLLLLLVRLAPDLARHWLAKEGPVEHLSHLILLAALLAWLSLTRPRSASPPSHPSHPSHPWHALFMAGFLALLLAEELDWGAVYGLPALGLRIDALLGHRNLHNALHGGSYLLFAAPLLFYFAAPARLSPRVAPIPDERAAFFALALLFLAWNLGPWERHAQELLEALLYTLLLALGLRLRSLRA